MSPLRSSAGPATVRMPTPSSSRTMNARLVLPSPGGPTSRTWSSASPRVFAASSAIASCSLIALLADEVVERARAEGALELLVVGPDRGGEELRGLRHAAFLSASPHLLLDRQLGSTPARAASASSSE